MCCPRAPKLVVRLRKFVKDCFASGRKEAKLVCQGRWLSETNLSVALVSSSIFLNGNLFYRFWANFCRPLRSFSDSYSVRLYFGWRSSCFLVHTCASSLFYLGVLLCVYILSVCAKENFLKHYFKS
jgi:hypothetical protein